MYTVHVREIVPYVSFVYCNIKHTFVLKVYTIQNCNERAFWADNFTVVSQKLWDIENTS